MGYEIAAGSRHGVEFGIVHVRHFIGPTRSELREKLEYRGQGMLTIILPSLNSKFRSYTRRLSN